MRILLTTIAIAGLGFAAFGARSDEPPKSQHQLVKECMAKQKAADSGKPTDELKSACKDIAKTQKENADAERKAPPKNP